VRAVIQRCSSAHVRTEGTLLGAIDPAPGLVVLLGVGPGDTPSEAGVIAGKIADLRIFSDTQGKINLSLRDVGGGALVISQFTLYADVRRGRRPGFTGAASPEVAAPLVERVIEELRQLGVPVQGGRFGADMQVELVNDGPMTILLDTDIWGSS
jgi:D-aminoacyl-tRNA deacylase